ncbi:ubiquitin-conjugating enzyme E2 S [Trichonephila clavata]|uniref:Ubiquitin-conjugating enzyme E2 S n=1 Tax=Trichonephila clavata TaxID=2740835 RepID=A0A8X6K511_TRICU|nr:ubiquitin-conjugating enzyme E2 S [Trichonephila clavata]
MLTDSSGCGLILGKDFPSSPPKDTLLPKYFTQMLQEMSNNDDYCERARMITEIHARPPKYTKEGLEEDPQSSSGTSASKGDGPTAKKHGGVINKLTVEKKNLK